LPGRKPKLSSKANIAKLLEELADRVHDPAVHIERASVARTGFFVCATIGRV
jgi:hypothetical protein